MGIPDHDGGKPFGWRSLRKLFETAASFSGVSPRVLDYFMDHASAADTGSIPRKYFCPGSEPLYREMCKLVIKPYVTNTYGEAALGKVVGGSDATLGSGGEKSSETLDKGEEIYEHMGTEAAMKNTSKTQFPSVRPAESTAAASVISFAQVPGRTGGTGRIGNSPDGQESHLGDLNPKVRHATHSDAVRSLLRARFDELRALLILMGDFPETGDARAAG